ncbi:hypothetical protein M2132_001549 [Dysgonomonas sp. PH5-45]|uniref:hypothetical protein n=1 Tax=unclassified Dysgonomonas TaxID=2630389 RepID=UPI002475C13C|nr:MULTISPECIES: hypothetical protein [unclassified Dysgonomonas]MDH6355212.1 hypothetical protein [Dysgonomonas sp. PH5-45]MDH6388062.1 hypothetical protein [Dysgonomonas sp. PH5-37]
MKTLLTAFLYILLFSSVAFAQKKTSGIDQYLDDGGFSNAKLLGKVNLTSIYQGDLHLSMEYLVSKEFSVEAGAGVLLGYYNDDPLNNFIDTGDDSLKNPKMGFSLSAVLKYYKDGMDFFYISIPGRARFIPGQIQLYEVSFAPGKQWVWDNRLLLDVSIGLGIQHQKSMDSKSYAFHAEERMSHSESSYESFPTKNRLIIPIAIKLGYLF